jgi:hypothetical protein
MNRFYHPYAQFFLRNDVFMYNPRNYKFLNLQFHYELTQNFDLSHFTVFAEDSSLFTSQYEYRLIEENWKQKYIEHLARAPYINFFIANSLDVPICFNKSLSLNRLSFRVPYLKFINFATRRGYQLKTKIYFVTALFELHDWWQEILLEQKPYYLFFDLFIYLNFFYLPDRLYRFNYISVDTELDFLMSSPLTEQGWERKTDYFIRSFLMKQAIKVDPIFTFHIYKINKFIRKYTRRKSGKYTLVWKYVPAYKRLFITLRWLIKDLKFVSHLPFAERLMTVFKNFIFFPHHSLVYKLKRYIYLYVFKNCRYSLMETLRSCN